MCRESTLLYEYYVSVWVHELITFLLSFSSSCLRSSAPRVRSNLWLQLPRPAAKEADADPRGDPLKQRCLVSIEVAKHSKSVDEAVAKIESRKT
jgi:hypothetical protein